MDISVYALYNQHSAKIYIGQTANLRNRLKRHNKKLPSKSTSFTAKSKGEWSVIYIETYNSRSEAIRREKQLKSCQGRKFIRSLIQSQGA